VGARRPPPDVAETAAAPAKTATAKAAEGRQGEGRQKKIQRTLNKRLLNEYGHSEIYRAGLCKKSGLFFDNLYFRQIFHLHHVPINFSLPAILLLEDGSVHYGKAFGKKGTTSGEICFNTGMTGYQEVFTDPSYYGQVLIMNSVHIGNYGVKESDVESGSVKIRGLIGRNLEEQFSRLQANGSAWMNICGLTISSVSKDVDTRSLVAHVRVKGAMNCVISSEISDIG
jgi:hypothetical protein